MNILLFHTSDEISGILTFTLESSGKYKVLRAKDTEEATKHLVKVGNVDLLLTNQDPETSEVLKFLITNKSFIPYILLSDQSQSSESAGKIEKSDTKTINADNGKNLSDGLNGLNVTCLGVVSIKEAAQVLGPMIEAHFDSSTSEPGETPTPESEYCPIKTDLLVRVVPLKGDVFIRLSQTKFVKMFKTGMQFTKEDFVRYLEKKKLSYLFIKKNDIPEFIDKFNLDLAAMVAKVKPGEVAVFNSIGEVQELVQTLASKLGFNDRVKSMAMTNVKIALKAIGSNPQISEALAASKLRDKNYLSSHSAVLGNLACSLAVQMRWSSDSTFHKLVLAALFHDFSLESDEQAKLHTLQELQAAKSSMKETEYQAILEHPKKSAECVQRFRDIPSDVDQIILQHHERPDGTGFPNKLKAMQMGPMASLFIFAHDILNEMDRLGDQFKFGTYIKDSEKRYQAGAFRQIWKELHNSISFGKITQKKAI